MQGVWTNGNPADADGILDHRLGKGKTDMENKKPRFGGQPAAGMDTDESRLMLAPHFSLHELAGDKFLLLSEERSIKLNDPFYGNILPLLDGRYNRAQVIHALSAKLGTGQENAFADFLAAMIDKGYVIPADFQADPARLAWLCAAGLEPETSVGKLAAFAVAIMPLGCDGAAGQAASADLAALLRSEGVTVTTPETATLILVVVEDYLQPGLRDWAEEARKSRKVWIPFKPGGLRPLLGPVIAPHVEGGACYHCLARRMVEHRPGDRIVAPTPSGPRPARAWTKATLALAQALAARELAEYALGRRQDIERHLLSWTTADAARALHPLPRFVDCPACGTPASGQDVRLRPVILAGDSIMRDADGGWRVLEPADVLQKLETIVSPLTGIVSAIKLTSPADGLFVYCASQGVSAPADPRKNRSLGRPGSASGKGLSDAQARISCLAEAIERHACQWSGSERQRQARWRDLGDCAPDPRLLLQFSARQYAERQTLNQSLGSMGYIPEPFREEAIIDWSPAWSLRDDDERWLPSRFCYFDYRADNLPGDHPFCFADSNGCASGGSLEEAILQGFLELVERDAISLWWYNRLQRRAIAAAGLDDAFIARMRSHYAAIGRDFHLLDLTTDLGIPVAVALSATYSGGRILMGFGAHLDGRLAALRALTELNQILLFDGQNGQAASTADPDFQQWIDQQTLAGHPYLQAANEPPLEVCDLPRPHFATLDEALRHCIALVADKHDFIVQDLGRPELPLSCVRVVVPGLCHFWNRRGALRLYEVPVAMGWRDRPSDESELNPIPFFL